MFILKHTSTVINKEKEHIFLVVKEQPAYSETVGRFQLHKKAEKSV